MRTWESRDGRWQLHLLRRSNGKWEVTLRRDGRYIVNREFATWQSWEAEECAGGLAALGGLHETREAVGA